MISNMLIGQLANPSWGNTLNQGVSGMFSNIKDFYQTRKDQEQNRLLMSTSGMFQQAAQTGNVQQAETAAKTLMAEGMERGNTEMYQQGMQMQQQIPTLKATTAASNLQKIDQALTSEQLNPEQRAILEARRRQLESTPGVQEIQREQQMKRFEFLKAQDAALTQRREQAISVAENAIINGASQEQVVRSFGADVYKEALKGANDFRAEQQRASELAQGDTAYTFSEQDPRYQQLSKEGQTQVKTIAETQGDKAALDELKKRYQDDVIKPSLAETKERRAAERSLLTEDIVQTTLDVERTGLWQGTDAGDWFEELETEEKERVRKLAAMAVDAERYRVGNSIQDPEQLRARLAEAAISQVERTYDQSLTRAKDGPTAGLTEESRNATEDDPAPRRESRDEEGRRSLQELLSQPLDTLSDEEFARVQAAASELP